MEQMKDKFDSIIDCLKKGIQPTICNQPTVEKSETCQCLEGLRLIK